jgi:hypothetical protein
MSLPVEVRAKIVSTFRHTMDLYRDGKLEDCLIGCDFILKMDPRFGPARKLQEKARNPKAEIDLGELQAVAAAATAGDNPPRETGSVAPARTTGSVPLAGSTPAASSQRRDTAPVLPREPGLDFEGPGAGGDGLGAGSAPEGHGLDELSLDSLSLDGPLPDLGGSAGGMETGLPFQSDSHGGFVDLAAELAPDLELEAPGAPSPQEEIAGLLRKGDEARGAGDRQQAIEIWSRIFLIDINNADAVTRIEETRREMSEEIRRTAPPAMPARDLAPPAAPAASFPPPSPPAPPAAPPAGSGLSPHDLSQVAAPGDVLAEELEQSGPPGGRRSWTSIGRPPRESAPDEPRGAMEPAAPAGRRLALPVSPRIAMIGAAALVVVGALAFFLLRPSRPTAPAAAAADNGPTLARATQLFQEGKIEETTAELQKIPPGHPDYDRAQKLLASLTDPKGAAVPAPEAPAGAPAGGAASSADPAALRADGERALSEKRYIDAMKSFSLAAPHFPGDPTFTQEMAAASEKVSELTPAVKLYNDGEYETAIPMLWRIHQESRDNQDARSYLTRSYFNQGVLQLQNGLFGRAKESFGEVLELDPNDVEAGRHRQFAEKYGSGELDLLGRIYVRYISPRP